MRLSEYPFVIVRIECAKCGRRGQYNLARLAERYGSEITLPWLRSRLVVGCPRHDHVIQHTYDPCAAMFVDVRSGRPPDLPPGAPGMRLRAVK